MDIILKLKKLNIRISVEGENIKLKDPDKVLTPSLIKEIKNKKAEILAFFNSVGDIHENTYKGINLAEKREYYPLSSVQKRIHYIQQLDKNNVHYNMPYFLSPENKVSDILLMQIFLEVTCRHEILRTIFKSIDGEIVQVVQESVDFHVENYEILAEQIPEKIKEFIRPFELDQGPLFRIGLFNIASGNQIIVFDSHHIIMDGTSQKILEKEILSLQLGIKLPRAELQYKDFSCWQDHDRKGREVENQKEYWLNLFSQQIPVLNFPLDYNRPEQFSFKGGLVEFMLEGKELDNIRELVKEHNVTEYIVFLSILNVLLSKLSLQEQIIVGMPTNGRDHYQLNNVLGMFVNTLPIISNPEGDKYFLDYLKEVKVRVLESIDNQKYQLNDLVGVLNLKWEKNRNTLFDVVFNMVNPDGVFQSSNSDKETIKYKHSTSRLDLSFSAFDYGQHIFFTIEYSTDIFKESTIARMADIFKQITIQIAKPSNLKLRDISLLSKEERNQILFEFNNTTVEFKDTFPVQVLFEQQVRKTPDKIAVAFEDYMLSYLELNREANRLANYLRDIGIKNDDVVGLMVGRSVYTMIGILGIIKAGGAFCPVDPDHPNKRIEYQLKNSKMKLLISSTNIIREKDIFSLVTRFDEESQIIVTPKQENIKDFDQLPIPNRGLIDNKVYHNFIGEAPFKHTVSLQATRGCPYQCQYCHKIWPKKHIYRGVESLMEEILQCYDSGIKRFAFIDDIMNLDKKNFTSFLEKIYKSQLDIQLLFPNGLRGDLLDKDIIDLMVQAGTKNIDLALETGSQRLQKLIKKNLDIHKFIENINYIATRYPEVLLELELMIGFPTETEAEANSTLSILKNIKWVHFPYLHVLKIYPNTDMYNFALDSGIKQEAIFSSTHLAYHELPETLPFSKTFVREYQQKFLTEYILLKDRLLHVLPHQMNLLSEDELVQKYSSFLPTKITYFNDILKYFQIKRSDLPVQKFIDEARFVSPEFNSNIKKYHTVHKPKPTALKILLLDLSLLLSEDSSDVLYEAIEPPLGLIYLLTFLQNKFKDNIQGKILKSRIDFCSLSDLRQQIEEFSPDIIGIRTLTCYKEYFHKAILFIRQWGYSKPIIAGGPYSTSDYSTLLKDTNIDLAVIGEGELVFGELIGKMFKNRNKFPKYEQLQKINGLAFRKKNTSSFENNLKYGITLLDQDRFRNYDAEDLPLINTNSDLVYLIYTSGSTGKPKGVMLEHKNIVNLIRYHVDYSSLHLDRVLQFASLSFDVSIQELFPPVMMGGMVNFISGSLRNDVKNLFKEIEKRDLSCLFLPSSFIKFIFNTEELIEFLPKLVRDIVPAGEQLIINEAFANYVKRENIRVHNHYGPSETHLCTVLTIDPTGEIPRLPSIGKPTLNAKIYILDSNYNLQPVGFPGEIYIAGDQVGRGYYNNELLTEERYLKDTISGEGIMYKSGDLGKWLPDGNIEFLGRIDHQVKVRGYRIELTEIESNILMLPAVEQCAVVARKDNQEQWYLCAFYTSNEELDVDELKKQLQMVLPEYMVPAYFVRLNEIKLSPNGKVDRNALPEITTKKRNQTKRSSDKITQKVISIWSEILEIDEASIDSDANFFSLGGHSLKVTSLSLKIQKEFNVEISILDIFENSTIEDLVSRIKASVSIESREFPKAEKKEYYGMSGGQRRLFFIYNTSPESTVYNMPMLIEIDKKIKREKIEHILNLLIKRHDGLRTTFNFVLNNTVQIIHEELEIKVEELEWNNYYIREKSLELIHPFNLTELPLVRAVFIKQSNTNFLFIDIPHILMDGTSQLILETEFKNLLTGHTLPGLDITYTDYSEYQNSSFFKRKVQKQEDYWLKKFSDYIPEFNLPTDYKRSEEIDYRGATAHFKINKDSSFGLKEIVKNENVTLYSLVLAIFKILLYKLSGKENIIVGSAHAARNSSGLENVVGMIANTILIVNNVNGKMEFVEYLQQVKKTVVEAFSNQDYQFDVMVSKLSTKRDLNKYPLFSIAFNLLNHRDYDDNVAEEYEAQLHTSCSSKIDMTFTAIELTDHIIFDLEYSTVLFKEETIDLYIDYFKKVVDIVINDRKIKIDDIKLFEHHDNSDSFIPKIELGF